MQGVHGSRNHKRGEEKKNKKELVAEACCTGRSFLFSFFFHFPTPSISFSISPRVCVCMNVVKGRKNPERKKKTEGIGEGGSDNARPRAHRQDFFAGVDVAFRNRR